CILPPVVEGRATPGPCQRPRSLSRVRSGGCLGLAHFTRFVPGGRALERTVGFSSALACGFPVPERPARALLWGRPCRGRSVPEGCPGPSRARGSTDTPLSDRDVCLHGGKLSHSPRSLPGPQCTGPGTPAAAGSVYALARGASSAVDHAGARGPSDQTPAMPAMPRNDQPARLYAGTLRRGWALPE